MFSILNNQIYNICDVLHNTVHIVRSSHLRLTKALLKGYDRLGDKLDGAIDFEEEDRNARQAVNQHEAQQQQQRRLQRKRDREIVGAAIARQRFLQLQENSENINENDNDNGSGQQEAPRKWNSAELVIKAARSCTNYNVSILLLIRAVSIYGYSVPTYQQGPVVYSQAIAKAVCVYLYVCFTTFSPRCCTIFCGIFYF